MQKSKWHDPVDLSPWHKELKNYSIDDCAVLSESNIIFTLVKERGRKEVIKLLRFFRDETPQFSVERLKDVSHHSTLTGVNATDALWISMMGEVYFAGKDKAGSQVEAPIPHRFEAFGYRTIGEIKKIGDHIYAAAGWRHVFKRKQAGEWEDISKNIDRSELIDANGEDWDMDNFDIFAGFRTVGGWSEDNLYAAGDDGDCWHYDGATWQRIDLPTNGNVYKIEALTEDLVYMACQNNTLLEGNRDNWRVISHKDSAGENFKQLVQFKGEIYVSTKYRMYKLVNGELEECMPSKQNVEIDMFCHHYLAANEDILLMCGQQSVAIFDGASWLPFAPNGPTD